MPANLYVDTSALLKRFVAEAGSDVVQEILTDPHFRGRLYIAAHTEPELISGLNERYRQTELAHRDVQASIARFKRLEAIFAVVGLGPAVVAEASLVLNRHRTASIRGADALHLGALRYVSRTAVRNERIVLVSADRPMGHVAYRMGIEHFDPTGDLPHVLL